MRNTRNVVADVLISLGVLALSLAAVGSVARRTFFLAENFADHLAASLGDPRVCAFVADRVTDAVLRENPDLTAFRPLILAAAQGTVSSTAFRAVVRTSARAAHESVFSEGGRSVIVSVPDVGVLVKSALAKANPALAQRVPEKVRSILASVGDSQADRVVLLLWRVSRRGAGLVATLLILGLALIAGGIATSDHRRRALARLGLDLLVAAALLLLLRPAGREIVALLPSDPLAGQAAAGVWDAFGGDLRTWGLALGAIGLVLTAAAWSLLERFDPAATARRVAAWTLDPPGGPSVRVLRGVLLMVLGGVAVVRPAMLLAALVVVTGSALAFAGLREVFEVVLGAVHLPEAPTPAAGSSARLRVGVVLAMVAVFVAAIMVASQPPDATPSAASDTCNGAVPLCGRTLDQVVFPTTHNAMSSADIPTWLFPQQEAGIATQLQDGIRGLLIDVHYGIPVADKIKTDLDSEQGSREKFERALGREAIDAAMRIRDRLVGQEEGPRGLYMCHGFCELGATPLGTALGAIHAFLAENPTEVLVMVIEDYVSPEELAAEFDAAGLADLVYRGPARPPWPTLREMIDTRQRVVVLTESGRPGVPWIRPAFEVLQETPYHFEKPSELSCAINRGGTAGSLFLVNNWIDTTPAPRPSNAAIVNAEDALLVRARQCAAARGLRPNLLAVDFYRTGALFPAVRALNEEPSPR